MDVSFQPTSTCILLSYCHNGLLAKYMFCQSRQYQAGISTVCLFNIVVHYLLVHINMHTLRSVTHCLTTICGQDTDLSTSFSDFARVCNSLEVVVQSGVCRQDGYRLAMEAFWIGAGVAVQGILVMISLMEVLQFFSDLHACMWVIQIGKS